MVEKHNYYGSGLYASNNTEKTAGSNAMPDWKQPSNVLQWFVQLIKNPASAARQVAAEGNIKTSLILIAINLISVLITSIIFVLVINIRYRLYFSWINIFLPGIIIIIYIKYPLNFSFPVMAGLTISGFTIKIFIVVHKQ